MSRWLTASVLALATILAGAVAVPVRFGSVDPDDLVYTADSVDAIVSNALDSVELDLSAVSNAIPTKVSQVTNDLSFVDKSVTNGLASEAWVDSFNYVDRSVTNGLASKAWVEGREYVTKSVTNGLASKDWVSGFNYVDKSVTNGLASRSWVDSFHYVDKSVTNGLASQTWVSGFNYVDKSVTNGLASQSWVEGKKYVTESVTNGLASRSWVEGRGYVTKDVTNELSATTASRFSSDEFRISSLESAGFVTKSVTNGLASEAWTRSWGTTNYLGLATWNTAIAPMLNMMIGSKASTNDLNSATNRIQVLEDAGYVTKSVTNGLASEAWVAEQGYHREGEPLLFISNSSYPPETNSIVPYFGAPDGASDEILFKFSNPDYGTVRLVPYRSVETVAFQSWVNGLGDHNGGYVRGYGNSEGEYVHIPAGGDYYLSSFVTKSVTNGLASQSWVEAKGYATESVTNGLASRSEVSSMLSDAYQAIDARVAREEFSVATNALSDAVVHTINGVTATNIDVTLDGSDPALSVSTNYPSGLKIGSIMFTPGWRSLVTVEHGMSIGVSGESNVTVTDLTIPSNVSAFQNDANYATVQVVGQMLTNLVLHGIEIDGHVYRLVEVTE